MSRYLCTIPLLALQLFTFATFILVWTVFFFCIFPHSVCTQLPSSWPTCNTLSHSSTTSFLIGSSQGWMQGMYTHGEPWHLTIYHQPWNFNHRGLMATWQASLLILLLFELGSICDVGLALSSTYVDTWKSIPNSIPNGLLLNGCSDFWGFRHELVMFPIIDIIHAGMFQIIPAQVESRIFAFTQKYQNKTGCRVIRCK